MVSWGKRVTSEDRYITVVSTVLVTAVTCLGFEYRSVHDGDRRGFTVKPTAKYVDECLDIVQLQYAKAVMTPGFEYRSVHDGDRRGFTVKLTAKYVDECLDIVHLQYAKAVMTPLTEQKSLNLHDETTACDQVQHSLFRAVVGKLQYSTRVRPDLMFATKMFVIQTCVTNTCRFDTCQESIEKVERNTRTESLLDDTCIETK